MVEAIKAFASQLIIWHHLAFYGPMSDAVEPRAPLLMDWLSEHARVVVQCFLVVGGFLAARSLVPRLSGPWRPVAPAQVPRLLWRRYWRLAQPYLIALGLAIACAAIARQLIQDPGTPAAPTLKQVIWHALLLQDIVETDALSAGVWYVAIDFQLYALLLLMVAGRPAVERLGVHAPLYAMLICGGMMLTSLFWWNRQHQLDELAPYFFGAYGLGVLSQWVTLGSHKRAWTAALALAVIVALWLEWRSRIAVAGLTALALIWLTPVLAQVSHGVGSRVLSWLARISYAAFLLHYPIFLLVGALVHRLWPGAFLPNLLGLIGTWLLSLAAATGLTTLIERPRAARA